MPGKTVECNNCGKSMRSDNLKRHEKTCNHQDSYPLTEESNMIVETGTKRKYVPPSFIYSVIEGNDEMSPPPAKKKTLIGNIRSIIPLPAAVAEEEIIPPSLKSLEDADGDSEDGEGEDESEDETEIDDQEQPSPQQLKDRLGSLMNLYLNDKHYELRDEIAALTDKLYNLKQFTQEKRL